MQINRQRMERFNWATCTYLCDRWRILWILASLSCLWVAFFAKSADHGFPSSTILGPVNKETTGPNVWWTPADPDPRVELKLKRTIEGNHSQLTPLLLDNCPVTSQLKLYIRPSDQKWVLQSLDIHGNEKRVGGDEFYVTYIDEPAPGSNERHPTAVAIILDQQDGTYELDFVAPPLAEIIEDSSATNNNQQQVQRRGGKVTFYLQYTCGIGHMAPPTKDLWVDGGSLLSYNYTVSIPYPPPIRPFQIPETPQVSLSKFDSVLAFGDSAMKQFVKNNSRAFEPNILYRLKTRKPWTMSLIEDHLVVLHKQLGRDLDDTKTKPVHSTALILGSAIWDVLASAQESNPTTRRSLVSEFTTTSPTTNAIFQDHLKACRHFITSVRQEYPNVMIFWKSPSAMHVHVVDPLAPINAAQNSAAERIRYMSSSRMEELYRLQRQLMAELQVPVLDIYEATYLSASWTFPGDGRHYRPELHRHLISWFYQ